MGNCVPGGHADELPLRRPPAAVVIHHEGRALEYEQPIAAGHVLARHPGCFICPVDSMHVDSQPVRVGESELLFPGNMYLLLPLSRLSHRFSLSDICELAVTSSRIFALAGSTAPLDQKILSQLVPVLPTIDEDS
ncbi:hypothetical protein EJ110_NYTH33952 [Nymphaea thermarum]|nr:hypothetical protein EJ110_NYTH33952 [Nymphaea thermarum]